MDAIKDLLLSSPGDALICPLCRDVYSNPMMTECGDSLCFGCHRDDSLASRGLIPNCALAMIIDNLPAKCPQHHQGCSWTGTLNEVRRHSLLCEKAPSRKIISPDKRSDTSTVATALDFSFECTSDSTETRDETDSSKTIDITHRLAEEVAMYVPMARVLESDDPLPSLLDKKYVTHHLARLYCSDGEDSLFAKWSIESYQNYYAPHFKIINDHTIVRDPLWHPLLRRTLLRDWDYKIAPMKCFMGEFYPVHSNGVPAIASESPPSSPSADEDYTRRMFIAFWLSGAMLVDGEFVVRPDAGDFFLPRGKALSVISAFMETMKAKGSIGTGNIMDIPADGDECVHHFQVFYHPWLQYDAERCEFKIRPGFEEKFIKRTSAIEHCNRVVSNLLRTPDMIMNVASEKEGGVYASFTPNGCVQSMSFVAESDMLEQILRDFPRLRQEPIRFFDAGAGLNLPGVMAALSQGWTAIGIENDLNRVALAAGFLRMILNSDIGGNITIGYQLRDISSPMNLSGILVFQLWDKVYTWRVVEGFCRNLHRSMSHDVILLMSTEHLHDHDYPRLDILHNYFHVVEGPTQSFQFKGGKQSDRLQLFRLSRRISVYTAPAPSYSIVAETENSIFNFSEKTAKFRRLENWAWDVLEKNSSKRAKTSKGSRHKNV